MCTFGILYLKLVKWIFNLLRSVFICWSFKAFQDNKKLSEFGFQFLYRPPFPIIIIFVCISDPAVHGRNRAIHQNFWHKTYFLLKLKTHSLPGQKTETLAEGWNSGARRPEAFFFQFRNERKRSLRNFYGISYDKRFLPGYSIRQECLPLHFRTIG